MIEDGETMIERKRKRMEKKGLGKKDELRRKEWQNEQNTN